MREAGWLLVTFGLLAILGAFMFVTATVNVGYVPYSPYSSYAPQMPSQVANLYGMHIQALVFQGGLVSFLAGVVCLVGSSITDAFARIGRAEAAEQATEQETVVASPYEDDGKGTGIAIALVIGLFAILVIGIIVGTTGTRGSAETNASNAMNAANAAMNDATAAAQNAAEQITREVDEAARQATRAADDAARAARGR